MMEAQDKLAQLWLGDQTFRQLALKVQQLVSVEVQGADEMEEEAHRVQAFLQALPPFLSRERYQTFVEVRAETEQQSALLLRDKCCSLAIPLSKMKAAWPSSKTNWIG